MNHSETQINSGANESFAAFIGLDWADEKHAVALLAAGSQTKENTTLEHTPEALSDWVAQLHQRFAGGKIAIILEQSRGSRDLRVRELPQYADPSLRSGF